MNRGEGMLEHLALDTNDLDEDQDTTEYRQYAVQVDFQETVWGLSDISGAQVERYLYSDPYGVTSTEDASGTGIGDYASEVYHQKRLHGGVVDAVAELYDFRNRWMDQGAGAWLSRDPLGLLDSPNLYQCYLDDPSRNVDPYGTTLDYNTGPLQDPYAGEAPAPPPPPPPPPPLPTVPKPWEPPGEAGFDVEVFGRDSDYFVRGAYWPGGGIPGSTPPKGAKGGAVVVYIGVKWG